MDALPRCHFCGRIATEHFYEAIAICGQCMVEKAGNEWNLYQTPWGEYYTTPKHNPYDLSDWTLIASGTYEAMQVLSLERAGNADSGTPAASA